ncbi:MULTISPECIES: FAD-binding protein [unclassified Kitasatospora]|uniref:FAD-binding protein n=1 Tax=unclassified Kitasatospora TaxID=2633591 RepID=UPI000709E7FF|nr:MULTISPECIES: FAD-binding protein [unclassified Kitasatospora]KQV14686.1 FAD-binding protein [Kitasatospora sp. Root107]KRB68227.1 FAD-binding protein [Kitasatospora sp. Root187]
MTVATTNWAGNITFNAERFHQPASVVELQEITAKSRSLRVLGTGHSFNTIADTWDDLVSLARLPRTMELDERAATVTVGAGLRFGELTGTLHQAGFALHNLGSLPHISVAGACATGTHGSGNRNGNLATAVRSLELVQADGELLTIGRDDPRFPGSVVALGALGAVTRLTLDLVPAFELRQWVYEDLPVAELREHFDELTAAAYSVSLFTDWRGDRINQVWVKRSDGQDAAPHWYGATLADGPRHPVPGIPAEPCTEQLGVPGPWYDRLPHFRLDFTPSSGDELQSEYFVARADAVAAFDALDAIRDRIAPALQISEIRTVAADGLWLSPAFERDTVAFHFTWHPAPAAVADAVRAIEQALAPFGARPHWGKVFSTAPQEIRELYRRYGDFEGLLAQLDPAGKFRNEFIARHFPADGRV